MRLNHDTNLQVQYANCNCKEKGTDEINEEKRKKKLLNKNLYYYSFILFLY